MLPVYICDDDSFWLKKLTGIILSCQIKTHFPFTLKCTAASPEELLRSLESEPAANGIYFLDMELQSKVRGLDLAGQIRRLDPRGYIVFVTSHSELALAVLRYKTEALDYIVKSDCCLEDRLLQCLLHIEKLYKEALNPVDNRILLKYSGIETVISLSGIIYIETVKNAHKITIHLTDGEHTLCTSLSKIQDKVGPHFLKCDQAYLVNPDYVIGIDHHKKLLLLKNGMSCPYSQRMYQKIRKQLPEICQKSSP